VAPDRQSAWVALAHSRKPPDAPTRLGPSSRGLARQEDVVDEWWSYRNGGLDREGLAWLRARVRR
jgi:hypothetical protein